MVAEVCYQYKVSCQYGCLLLLHVYTMKIKVVLCPKNKKEKEGNKKTKWMVTLKRRWVTRNVTTIVVLVGFGRYSRGDAVTYVIKNTR